jgi:LPS-assembly lipoprotein
MWSRDVKTQSNNLRKSNKLRDTKLRCRAGGTLVGGIQGPPNVLRTSAVATAIVLCAILSGCGAGGAGFSPLHGPTASGVHLNDKFAAVDFATIPGRVGQRIRNELVFEKSSAGTAAPAAHRLEVKVVDSIATTLVKINGDSQGQVYQVEASYRLIDLKTNKMVFEGRSLSRASFERFESIYSNVRAREDAENRAAENIANDIRTRLSAYLSQAT